MLPSACRSIKALQAQANQTLVYCPFRFSAAGNAAKIGLPKPALPIMAWKMESLGHLPRMRHEGD
jgi:hypothetical protein